MIDEVFRRLGTVSATFVSSEWTGVFHTCVLRHGAKNKKTEDSKRVEDEDRNLDSKLEPRQNEDGNRKERGRGRRKEGKRKRKRREEEKMKKSPLGTTYDEIESIIRPPGEIRNHCNFFNKSTIL